MSRHVIDRPAEPEGGRLQHFLTVERQLRPDGSHPAARLLHERPNARQGVSRLREFIRIAKGRSA